MRSLGCETASRSSARHGEGQAASLWRLNGVDGDVGQELPQVGGDDEDVLALTCENLIVIVRGVERQPQAIVTAAQSEGLVRGLFVVGLNFP